MPRKAYYRDPRRPIVLHVAQWPGAAPLSGPPGDTSWYLGVPQPVWAGWYDLTHDCPPLDGWPPWPDGTEISAREVVSTPQTGHRRRVRRGSPVLRFRVRHLGGGRWLVDPDYPNPRRPTMSRVNDGGPAFPRTGFWPDTSAVDRDDLRVAIDTITPSEAGMTLRDFFAAHALAGLIAAHGGETPIPDDGKAARWSYGYADAMLTERDKPKPAEVGGE